MAIASVAILTAVAARTTRIKVGTGVLVIPRRNPVILAKELATLDRIMDLATGRRNRIPIAQLVRRTVRELEPHARELGSERELEGIAALLARGNSADRQLRVFNANRDIREVVEEIAIATETLPVDDH